MDPCWLPSAIMQTTGAMLGIYIGIYVLAIQRYLKSLEKLRGSTSMTKVLKAGREGHDTAKVGGFAVGSFYLLIFACGFTIIANAFWLDSLATNIVIPKEVSVLGVIGLSSFLISVGYICYFSISLTKRLLG